MVMVVEHNTFLLALALAVVAKAFGEWIVIDFQLGDLDRCEGYRGWRHERARVRVPFHSDRR